MVVAAMLCRFAATIECPLVGGELVELAGTWSCDRHWRYMWSLVWFEDGVLSWWPFAVQMVVLIDVVGSCCSIVIAPRIPLCRPIGLLPNLCMIIECPMYTVCRFRFRFWFMATLYHTIL